MTATVEKPKALTPEAMFWYTSKIDSTGTTPQGYLPLPELARLANYLAGGPGQLIKPCDRVFYRVVVGGEEPSAVLEEMQELGCDWDPTSKAFKELWKSQQGIGDVEQWFSEKGINRSTLESKKLCQSITLEQIMYLIQNDGPPVIGALSGEKFQPIKAFIVKRDLTASASPTLESALAKDDQGHNIEVGNCVLYLRGGDLVPVMERGRVFFTDVKKFFFFPCRAESNPLATARITAHALRNPNEALSAQWLKALQDEDLSTLTRIRRNRRLGMENTSSKESAEGKVERFRNGLRLQNERQEERRLFFASVMKNAQGLFFPPDASDETPHRRPPKRSGKNR